MEIIRFECGCGKRIKVAAHFAGQEGKCPACGAGFVVPNPPMANGEQPIGAAPEEIPVSQSDTDELGGLSNAVMQQPPGWHNESAYAGSPVCSSDPFTVHQDENTAVASEPDAPNDVGEAVAQASPEPTVSVTSKHPAATRPKTNPRHDSAPAEQTPVASSDSQAPYDAPTTTSDDGAASPDPTQGIHPARWLGRIVGSKFRGLVIPMVLGIAVIIVGVVIIRFRSGTVASSGDSTENILVDADTSVTPKQLALRINDDLIPGQPVGVEADWKNIFDKILSDECWYARVFFELSHVSSRATGECQQKLRELERLISRPPPGGSYRKLWALYMSMNVRTIAERVSEHLIFSESTGIQQQWEIVIKYLGRSEYQTAGLYLSNFYNAPRGVECSVALSVLFLKLGGDGMHRVEERFGLSFKGEIPYEGIKIVRIFPGTAAAEVGLVAGDTITSVDGTYVGGGTTAEQALRLLNGNRGTFIRLNVVGTDGHARTVTVEREPWLSVR